MQSRRNLGGSVGETAMMKKAEWELLMERIDNGKCTPFLGAGACSPTLPLGGEIAKEWAADFSYPLTDDSDLTRVAQYLSVARDAMFPKDQMVKTLQEALDKHGLPDFGDPSEPHGFLAELPLPVYMTTNYDDFMFQALLKKKDKDPKREFCRWNGYVQNKPTIFDDPAGFQPTAANPLVYHLHGHSEVVESMVLTEDDYLDFLVNVTRDRLLPERVEEAMTGASLLFVGYSLADWNFRVLFRGLVASLESGLRRISVTVQLPPGEAERAGPGKAKEYLDEYFYGIKMKVYWGTAAEFTTELRRRWNEYKNGK